MGLFISTGAAGVSVRECIKLLQQRHYIDDAFASRAKVWLPPAVNLLLLLGLKRLASRKLRAVLGLL